MAVVVISQERRQPALILPAICVAPPYYVLKPYSTGVKSHFTEPDSASGFSSRPLFPSAQTVTFQHDLCGDCSRLDRQRIGGSLKFSRTNNGSRDNPMTTASLARMVRDHRTGEVHRPHEPVAVLQSMQNLGRTLFKIKWETGGESILLADDLEARPQRYDA